MFHFSRGPPVSQQPHGVTFTTKSETSKKQTDPAFTHSLRDVDIISVASRCGALLLTKVPDIGTLAAVLKQIENPPGKIQS